MNILILMHFADIVDMLIESTLSTLVAWKFRPKYFQLSSWWSCAPAAARPPRPSGGPAATPWWRARGPSSDTATSSPTSTSASPSGAGSESWWVPSLLLSSYFGGARHILHLERRKYFTAAWFIQIGGFLVVGLQLKWVTEATLCKSNHFWQSEAQLWCVCMSLLYNIVYFWEPTPTHFKYSLVYMYLQDRNVEKHFSSTVAEILKHASSGTQTNSSETLGGQNLARNPHLTWKDIMTNISSRPWSWSDLAPSPPRTRSQLWSV